METVRRPCRGERSNLQRAARRRPAGTPRCAIARFGAMERTNGGTNNKDGGHESADAAEQQETPELGLRLRAAHGCLVRCLALCLLTDGCGREFIMHTPRQAE